MAPVQRPIHIKNLFVEIVKCFKKAGDKEILESMQRTLEICLEISQYANDMMKAGRIVGCPVSIIFLIEYSLPLNCQNMSVSVVQKLSYTS